MKEIEKDMIRKLARFTKKIKTEFIKGVRPQDLMLRLKKKHINVVVDIRWWSVFPPYYAPKNLIDLLAAHNILYKEV